MRNIKGFSVLMIFLLLFQIASSSLDFTVAAEKAQADETQAVDLRVKGSSEDENSITWIVDLHQTESPTEEVRTSISFDDNQGHGRIEDTADSQIEHKDMGYDLQTSNNESEQRITITTEIINEEASHFSLTVKTRIQDESFTVEESIVLEREEAVEDEVEAEIEEEAETEAVKEEKSETDQESGVDLDQDNPSGENQEAEQGQSPEGEEPVENESVIQIPPFAQTSVPQALPGIMSSDEWPNPGSLRLDKKAKPTDDFAKWEVELEVEGKNLKRSSDIVLVFDRSNSMHPSRLSKAKNAANQFVDNLLTDETSTVRIALVPFGTNADSHTDFQDFQGREHLKNKINAIRVTGGNDGGTNIQAGLHRAENLLNGSTADQKTIVLLSDGAPTYSYKAGRAQAHSWPNNKYNFILSNFNYNNRLGNGSDYTLPAGFFGFGGQHYTVDGYRVTTNGIATISEAQNIINRGIDIYSIGLEVGNDANATYVLDNSQNKGYYAGGDDDMGAIFEEVAAEIGYAATQAKVTDPLGDMFNLVKDAGYQGEDFQASHGSVQWDDASETFTWDLGSIKEGETYTLKYQVMLDCDKEAKVNTEYPTNKRTTLDYRDYNGSDARKDFPIPKVKIDSVKITKLGYRVNVQGEPLDSDGNPVPSPEEAQQFYQEIHGSDLEANQSYEVAAGTRPDGYVLHPDFSDPTVIEVTDLVCHRVYFGYVKESELPAGDVKAIYVDEAGNEIAGSESFTGNIGESYETVQKDIPGYEFKEMGAGSADPSGSFTSEEQTVIYVYKKLVGTIKLIKVDADHEEIYLAGAKFDIKDANGQKVGELETDENGVALSEALAIGDYTLVETEAPEGYERLEGENLTVTVLADEEVEITVKNKQLKGSLKIIKVDADDSSELLAGAEFELVDENNVKQTATTNDQGEIIFDDLALGKYSLKEIKAPAGYRLLNNPIEIELTAEDLEMTKTIENSKQDWEIPQTGGIGSLGFYGIGFLLMATALWFVIRRKYI